MRGGERADEELPLNIGLENKRSFPEESFWDAFYLNNFKILPFSKGKMHLLGYLEKKLFLETPPPGLGEPYHPFHPTKSRGNFIEVVDD